MSCHVTSRHVTSRHVTTSRHVMSCHVTSRHVTSCHVMSCHVMSCHVMSCHVIARSCAQLRAPSGVHTPRFRHVAPLPRGVCTRAPRGAPNEAQDASRFEG